MTLSCPGRGAALSRCSAEPGPTSRRWTPDQQRTTAQLRRAAHHPGNERKSLPPQLPFVRRVVRLIDGELVHRGLPEVLGEPRRPQIDLALGDLAGERAVEVVQRA